MPHLPVQQPGVGRCLEDVAVQHVILRMIRRYLTGSGVEGSRKGGVNGQGKAVEGQGNAVDRSRKGSGKVEERQWKGRGKAMERPGRRQCGRPGERQCLLCHPAVLVGTLQQPFVGPAAARRHSIHPPLGLMRWSHGEIRLLTAEERGQSKGGQRTEQEGVEEGSEKKGEEEKRRRETQRSGLNACFASFSLCMSTADCLSVEWSGGSVATGRRRGGGPQPAAALPGRPIRRPAHIAAETLGNAREGSGRRSQRRSSNKCPSASGKAEKDHAVGTMETQRKAEKRAGLRAHSRTSYRPKETTCG